MPISDIYIYALRHLEGFDEEAIETAISLAKYDVVEDNEDFIDFVNFNIEDRKFPHITKPFKIHDIEKAVDIAKENESYMPHYIDASSPMYPKKILQSSIANRATLSYIGDLKNIERKTIMITGSSAITENAKQASTYFASFFSKHGYNILTSFSDGCEKSAFSGCVKASGFSTFILPHSIEYLSEAEKGMILPEIMVGRSTIISASKSKVVNKRTRDVSYRYLAAILDCLIVPQLSFDDDVINLVINCLMLKKPVFFIRYTRKGNEYDCESSLLPLGLRYISSITALYHVSKTIGLPENKLD